GLAELRARREELSRRIREEEAERDRLQGRLGALTQRLARTGESLARNLVARGELDRTIAETEAAYGKILESSQTLLDVLKEETGNAGKASEP
ncbi:SSNA1 protein, partial [Arenaria interpres]|nr:SSNA1 protein [Arenaria interpres]